MKKATRFELNGKVYEMNDKGNRFFVSDEANGICRKRIGQASFEKALEEFTALEKANELDAGMGKLGYSRITNYWNPEYFSYSTCDGMSKVMNFTTVEEGLNWVKEQIGAEEPKKEEKKARRSKDIAHESNGVTLTAKQVDFLHHLKDTCFWEKGLDSAPWCDVLADEIGGQFAGKPMTVGAMISTLREKGLVNIGREDGRKGKPKFMVLTELGKKVAAEVAPELA